MGNTNLRHMELCESESSDTKLKYQLFFEIQRHNPFHKPIEMFSRVLSEDVSLSGFAFCNVNGLSKHLVDQIKAQIDSNIYLQNGEYLDGFQSVFEIISDYLRSPYSRTELISLANQGNEQPFVKGTVKVCVNCLLRIGTRLIFLRELKFRNTEEIEKIPNRILYKLEGAKDFHADNGHYDEKTGTDIYLELKHEIAQKITSLIMTDVITEPHIAAQPDPRKRYPLQKHPEGNHQHIHQLRILLPEKISNK